MRTYTLLLMLFCAPALLLAQASPQPETKHLSPKQLVERAIEYWRDSSSYTAATMVIHRDDWERSLSLISWTSGRKKSLVRFTAPAKDAGSASLTLDNEMWSFAPKINRVIKIPSSMMHQSWMGSDFSYNDLSKTDD
ncbi:MAG: outer membrane lipoprotein-sorting protein, partial [Bdellovibrionales bacterium]|nr:outer membrane lipoprotein-sorting protein [Bdellovibrionales bacterium]